MVLTRVEQSRCWSMINVPSLMHVVYEVPTCLGNLVATVPHDIMYIVCAS